MTEPSRPATIANCVGDTVLYGLPRVTFMAVSLVMIPLYSHYFGVAEYGLIENLNILGVLLTLVFGLALSEAVTRFYAVVDTEHDRREILFRRSTAHARRSALRGEPGTDGTPGGRASRRLSTP